MRARARLFLHRFEKEIFVHVETLEAGDQRKLEKARAAIRDRLNEIAPIFNKQNYIMGDEFSMLDVAMAPLLWRLNWYEVDLPKTAAPVLKYAERIFQRQGYIDALTPAERGMRR
jgi:RNA polymerase-associated protein